MRTISRLLIVFCLLLVSLGVSAQELRIASYNMERLGENHKDYATLAKVISNFDVVAAIEVMNERGMKNVMQKLPAGWNYEISDTSEGSKRYREFYGFFYDDKVEVVRDLGEYPGVHEFFRPPYGTQFRVKGTNFEFNVIACHIIYGHSDAGRVLEINNLGKVYRHFENLTGNKGTTIIAGDFNEERIKDFSSLVDLGDQNVIPLKGSTIGMRGPDHGYDHMFMSAALRPLVTSADVFYWTTDFEYSRKYVSDHFPVFVELKIPD